MKKTLISEVEESTDDHVNRMKQGVSSILVTIRIRPLTSKELSISSKPIAHVLQQKVIVLDDPTYLGAPQQVFRQNRANQQHYAFDFVLGPETTQKQTFLKTAKFLLQGVLNGFNATIFAYGATGAGKTYTMVGDPSSPGLMLNTFLDFFSQIQQLQYQREYKIKLSYIEIYNQIIRDLLSTRQTNIQIREDRQRGITLQGLSESVPTSVNQVSAVIRNGNRKRTCEPTEANKTSSRSHAILQITVEHRDKASGTNAQIFIGKLSLIDLAGSERAASNNNRGIRLLEGANINRSLLALGNCINALCEAQARGINQYIPYRDSKLTRILKDSLGGNCRTVMIACISPFYGTFEDTHNTLKYANRAKNIKTKVSRNVLNSEVHISKYTSIINQLKQEVSSLRLQLKNRQPGAQFDIDHHLIELHQHFKQQTKLRKALQQSQQSIDQAGFVSFSRQMQLDKLQTGENRLTRSLTQQLQVLKSTIKQQQNRKQDIYQKIKVLQKRRNAFYQNWKALLVPEPFLSQLQLKMQEHILQVSDIHNEHKDHHCQAVIKQKDLIIDMLSKQLQLRDGIISASNGALKKQNIDLTPEIIEEMKRLISVQQIASHNLLSPTYHSGKKVQKRSEPSRIPQPRGVKTKRTLKQVASEVIRPSYYKKLTSRNVNFFHPDSRPLKRKAIKEISTSQSSDSESSAHSHQQPVIKIADKFRKSPYVTSVSPGGYSARFKMSQQKK